MTDVKAQGRQHQPPGCRAKSNKTSNGSVIAVAPLIPSPEEIDAALESQRRLDGRRRRRSCHPPHRPARIPCGVPPGDPPDYGLVIALYLGLALATLAAVFYWAARALGLGDLGKKVGLVERSVRRGEGDRELAEALQRDVEGKWE